MAVNLLVSLRLCSRRQMWFCTQKGHMVLLSAEEGVALGLAPWDLGKVWPWACPLGLGEGVAPALSPGTWGRCGPGLCPLGPGEGVAPALSRGTTAAPPR